MEFEIKKLLKRLAFLGYCSFQIKSMIADVVGTTEFKKLPACQRLLVIKQQLETYEQLGRNYLYAYSK